MIFMNVVIMDMANPKIAALFSFITQRDRYRIVILTIITAEYSVIIALVHRL